MTAGYNPHAGGVVKEYKSTDIAIFDNLGAQQVINLAQAFVFRATQMGKLLFLEIEFQVTVTTGGGATFLQVNLPPELNPKDSNTVAIIGAPQVSTAAKVVQFVNSNVVGPTPITGANPVTAFLQIVAAAGNFPAGPVNFFGVAFWTLA